MVCIDEKTEKESYLLPQYCAMTGLTEQNLTNFSLMKELATHTNKNAQDRVNLIGKFLEAIHEKSKETL